MSALPCVTALEPSISTSPAFMKTLIRVLRSSRPLPYVFVRHSVLARLPVAPLGHRFALPAALTTAGVVPTKHTTSATAVRLRCVLRNRRAHQQPLSIALRERVPNPGAGDQRQGRAIARGEQGCDARVGVDGPRAGHLEDERDAIAPYDSHLVAGAES